MRWKTRGDDAHMAEHRETVHDVGESLDELAVVVRERLPLALGAGVTGELYKASACEKKVPCENRLPSGQRGDGSRP